MFVPLVRAGRVHVILFKRQGARIQGLKLLAMDIVQVNFGPSEFK